MRTWKTYNLDVMKNKDALSYYLLGVFMTDGCVKLNPDKRKYEIEISSKDRDWLEAINKVLSPDNLIHDYSGYHALTIHSKELAYWLEENKCTPRKSLTLEMPDVPKEYFRDFLRGCIDGDGCITTCTYTVKRKYGTYTYRKYGAYLCSASQQFIDGIESILTDLKFKFSKFGTSPEKQTGGEINGRKVSAKNSMYRITFNDKGCIDLLKFLYYDDSLLCLPRKRNIANQMLEFYNNK